MCNENLLKLATDGGISTFKADLKSAQIQKLILCQEKRPIY
jgi:hypothetical protein